MADVGLLARYKVDNSDFTKKTNEAKRSLEQFGMKGTEVGNKISQITNILNANVGALSKLAVGLGAAGAAAKVAGDAFKQNEVAMDEWNKNIEAAKSVYDGFLNALNTGDISGYLQNINNIVKAARDAYDAMDDLGTFNAFNQINAEENRANLSEALANFKSGSGSKTDIAKAAQAVKDDLTERQKYEQNAYDKAINSLAESRGVNADMLRDALSGKYGAYQNIKGTKMTGTETVYYGGGMFGGGGSYQKAVPANEIEKLGNMLAHFTDDELQAIQAIGAQAKRTGREIADVDKQVAKYTKEGAGGNGGGKEVPPAAEGSIDAIKEKITELNKQLGKAVSDEARRDIFALIDEAEQKLRGMQAATKGSGIDLSGVSKLNLSAGTSVQDKLKGDAKTFKTDAVKKAGEAWEDYQRNVKAAHEANQQAIGSLAGIGQALQSIQNPAAKVLGIVAEAIANVALAAGKAVNADDTTSSGWAWIGAAAAITAEMITTISAIKSATSGFANGGEIKGNSYSGDNLLMPMVGGGAVAVNAGEYVFNRAQLGNLAAQLRGGADQRAQEIRVRIENDQLVGTLRNAGARAGYRV